MTFGQRLTKTRLQSHRVRKEILIVSIIARTPAQWFVSKGTEIGYAIWKLEAFAVYGEACIVD